MELSRLAETVTVADVPGEVRLPKYLRLSDGIMQAIETGELASGERLPGESELTEVLPFSLGTVQKALSHLAERGAIVRRHGSGTFVADGPSQLNDLWHFRFPDSDGQSLLPVFTRATGVERVETGGPWTAFLGDEAFHVRVDRVINVNHEFEAVAHMFFSGARFGDLLSMPSADFENCNMRSLLRERYNEPTLRIAEEAAAETLPPGIASALGLPAGSCGLVLHIQGYGFRDRPLSYQVVYIPPDTRRLELKLQNP